jgi:aryl-alcohol dehydrogenase-like predicted oxidoreductase
LPLNIVDQRASLSGLLTRLQAHGVEVHVRSAFLQGALLMAPESLPAHLAPLRAVVRELRSACWARGWTAQQACLRFIAGTAGVDKIVCGVNSLAELDELITNLNDQHEDFDYLRFATNDSTLINPSKWPRN